MSEFLVLEELGSETSRSSESRHTEEHGEFGVTWSAEERCDAQRRVKSVKRADFAMMFMLCEWSGPSISGRGTQVQPGVKGYKILLFKRIGEANDGNTPASTNKSKNKHHRKLGRGHRERENKDWSWRGGGRIMLQITICSRTAWGTSNGGQPVGAMASGALSGAAGGRLTGTKWWVDVTSCMQPRGLSRRGKWGALGGEFAAQVRQRLALLGRIGA